MILFVLLPVEAAAIWSLLGGYLLLPSAMSVDVALLPPLDKSSIPAISTFLLCWMKGTQSPAPQRSLLIYALAFAFVVSPIFTSLGNSYELHIGDRSLPGFYPLDGIKLSLHNIIALLPFFIGMRFLSSESGRALLLRSLPAAALVYSLPMLFEIRMSPQLHTWVYGYFPHSFGQQIRDGGFRPVVFLGHGLEVAFFASIAVIAAAVGIRARWQILRVSSSAATAYLSVVLLLCKTLGALIYAVVAVPLVLFTKPRAWVRVACAIFIIFYTYPLLRTYNLIPVKAIATAANSVSSDRSSSFQTRVDNEDKLLAKANEKALFGWGTWGRNRIYDQDSGRDISITDGEWVIQLGMFGWFGYLSLFGLFAAAAMRARKAVRGPVTQASLVLGGMTLLLAVNMIDLIPNADLLPFTYLMAGSIAGCIRVKSKRPFTHIRPVALPVAVALPS
ncbi:hypothetical protein [Sphingomonas agri]|uniref:hypothetical protein n=1 Tax=Sphingomonas agri TaxID=1813878 RepID=UPI00311E8F7A